MGVLQLSHDVLFKLTPFQFTQLYEGYREREKIDAIKRAELIVALYNTNQFSDKPKTYEIGDVLPWYDEYVSGKGLSGKQEYVEYPQQEIDLNVPQLERVTKRLLEEKGIDPNAIKRDSKEWIDAEKVASDCVSGGTGKTDTTDTTDMSGFTFRKADPKEWGTPPWEIER